MSDTALVIMARYPEKGKVKTRLARHIGEEQTLHLYQAFLSDLASRFANQVYDLYWAYTPAEADFESALALLPQGGQAGQCFAQKGVELGARLHQVFLSLTERYQYIIIIASDSPHISQHIVAQAQQALMHTDIVLGPTDDGGYYLIGMRQPYDVFSEVPMSTEKVLQMTIERARSQELSVYLLPQLFDIDEVADLLRLARILQKEQMLAPMTAACLTDFAKELVW